MHYRLLTENGDSLTFVRQSHFSLTLGHCLKLLTLIKVSSTLMPAPNIAPEWSQFRNKYKKTYLRTFLLLSKPSKPIITSRWHRKKTKFKIKTRRNQLGGGDSRETFEPNRQQLKQMSTMILIQLVQRIAYLRCGPGPGTRIQIAHLFMCRAEPLLDSIAFSNHATNGVAKTRHASPVCWAPQLRRAQSFCIDRASARRPRGCSSGDGASK